MVMEFDCFRSSPKTYLGESDGVRIIYFPFVANLHSLQTAYLIQLPIK